MSGSISNSYKSMNSDRQNVFDIPGLTDPNAFESILYNSTYVDQQSQQNQQYQAEFQIAFTNINEDEETGSGVLLADGQNQELPNEQNRQMAKSSVQTRFDNVWRLTSGEHLGENAIKIKIPEIIYLSGIDEIRQYHPDYDPNNPSVAWVNSYEPEKIYINSDLIITLLPSQIDETLEHESIHVLSNGFIINIRTQYNSARNEQFLLEKEYISDPWERSESKSFSVDNLLIEGITEYLTEKNDTAIGAAYVEILPFAQKLVNELGEDVVRKGFFENDAVATQAIVDKAIELSNENNFEYNEK